MNQPCRHVRGPQNNRCGKCGDALFPDVEYPPTTPSDDGQNYGWWVEFKRGWWQRCVGPNKNHKERGECSAHYHGSVTEEESKELERRINYFLGGRGWPDGDAEAELMRGGADVKITVGGSTHVRSIREWHALAVASFVQSETALTDEKGRPMTYWGGAASPDKKDDAWRSAALRLGEQLAPTGPNWYYAMTPTQWLEWCQSALPSAGVALSAAEMTRLMTAAGYDTSKAHPACYERFSYCVLLQLLNNAGVPSATLRITDEVVERALAAANGAMVDTRRHWTDGDRAAVRAMLEAAQPPDRLARAERLLREFITTCEVHNVRADKFFDLATDVAAARAYFKDASTDRTTPTDG